MGAQSLGESTGLFSLSEVTSQLDDTSLFRQENDVMC